ncbi:hypothetical protein ACOME3_000812 [Neoechinorhynchus agilis]
MSIAYRRQIDRHECPSYSPSQYGLDLRHESVNICVLLPEEITNGRVTCARLHAQPSSTLSDVLAFLTSLYDFDPNSFTVHASSFHGHLTTTTMYTPLSLDERVGELGATILKLISRRRRNKYEKAYIPTVILPGGQTVRTTSPLPGNYPLIDLLAQICNEHQLGDYHEFTFRTKSDGLLPVSHLLLEHLLDSVSTCKYRDCLPVLEIVKSSRRLPIAESAESVDRMRSFQKSMSTIAGKVSSAKQNTYSVVEDYVTRRPESSLYSSHNGSTRSSKRVAPPPPPPPPPTPTRRVKRPAPPPPVQIPKIEGLKVDTATQTAITSFAATTPSSNSSFAPWHSLLSSYWNKNE